MIDMNCLVKNGCLTIFKPYHTRHGADGILESVKAWQGKAKQSDDLTLLEIWRDEN